MPQLEKIEAYNFANLKILIVDDNQNMRTLVRNVLRAFGIRRVREAEDGSIALKVITDFKPDITICDWNMKRMSGIEFTRNVRASSDPLISLHPIIMLTGYSDVDRVMEARDSGVNEYLSKPVSATSLYKKMVSIVDNPRAFVLTENFFGPDRRRHTERRELGIEDRRNSHVVVEDYSEEVFLDVPVFDKAYVDEMRYEMRAQQKGA